MADARAASAKSLTIVVPVFNEESNVGALVAALAQALDEIPEHWSVLFVDDGSSDATLAALRALAAKEPRVSVVAFSRNFGKEAAIAAGLRYARGDAVVVMDADLQHPPDVVPSFLAAWRGGFEMVFGLRQNRVGETRSRRSLSRLFYRLFMRISDLEIPEGATDFVLLDRKAVDAMNALGERCRFTKGLYTWIGFRRTLVPFVVAERNDGGSRWSLVKLGNYAVDAFSSFSSLPLKVWSYVGVVVSLTAIGYAIYFVIQTLLFGVDVPGFPSLIVSITFFAGVQLISLGVLGEYVARLFQEVKQRPLFVVAERIGGDQDAPFAKR